MTGRRISRLILLSGTWLAAASLIFLPLIEMATDIIRKRDADPLLPLVI